MSGHIEEALPVLEDWLGHRSPVLFRHAVPEGAGITLNLTQLGMHNIKICLIFVIDKTSFALVTANQGNDLQVCFTNSGICSPHL